MKNRLIQFLPFFLVLTFAAGAQGEQVSAKYIAASGSHIRLQLTINKPAPQNVIVEQYLPSGTKIISSSPKIKKNNLKNGTAKWLLKGLTPGNMVISMKVSPALPGRATGKLTYRHPQNGNLIEKRF